MPVAYCHVIFKLPAPIGDIAYQNKAEIYGIHPRERTIAVGARGD